MLMKSGRSWIAWSEANAPNSKDVEALVDPFRICAREFVAALRKAGATVQVDTTKRSSRRAYMFHWSWKIAHDKCKPSDAIPMDGVDIQWDHGDLTLSRKAALEMVTGFGLAVPPRSINAPALSSNHITGRAIDMTIIWKGTIVVTDKTGTSVPLVFMPDVNANRALHAVGASYGVKKLATDAPHWSHDGR